MYRYICNKSHEDSHKDRHEISRKDSHEDKSRRQSRRQSHPELRAEATSGDKSPVGIAGVTLHCHVHYKYHKGSQRNPSRGRSGLRRHTRVTQK